MSTTTVISRIFAQIQKLLDIQMPGFQVGTYSPLALAALIYCYCCIVHYFQKRHQALALAIGAFDIGTHGTYGSPIVAEAASKL